MKKRTHLIYILFSLWLIIIPLAFNNAWAKEFVVVIDPGHGGRDPGALGKIAREKDINLKVALKLGSMIRSKCKDVRVVYTREKDVFVSLQKRADIANKEKADLFLSIHTNSIKGSSTLKGASTWTLGPASSQENLAVAQRENAVITLEDDYQTRYEGFNPNSSESYIIFDLVQSKYMEESIKLARIVQKHFKNSCKRVDKGVHQAGFLVLRHTAMPSVLVELGFISTPEEELYLSSEAGALNMADGIFRAFIEYKNIYQEQLSQVSVPKNNSTPSRIIPVASRINSNPTRTTGQASSQANSGSKKNTKKVSNALTTPALVVKADKSSKTEVTGTHTHQNLEKDLIFKVQILTASKILDKDDKRFKGLSNVDYYRDGKIYKYTYGASADYNKVVKTRRSVSEKFKDAFIVAFKDGKRIDVNEAIKEFKRKRNK